MRAEQAVHLSRRAPRAEEHAQNLSLLFTSQLWRSTTKSLIALTTAVLEFDTGPPATFRDEGHLDFDLQRKVIAPAHGNLLRCTALRSSIRGLRRL